MEKLYNISFPQIKKTSHINKYKQISVECLLSCTGSLDISRKMGSFCPKNGKALGGTLQG